MSDMFCTYRGDRERALVAYLYDDIEPAERKAFEAHVATCDVCSTELAGLGVVRARLARWAPPEPSRALTPLSLTLASGDERAPIRATWRDVPPWMQAVAAVLLLGVAAGAANLDVKYNQDGLSVRTGWLGSARDAVAVPEKPVTAASAAVPSVSQDDLAAVIQTLRGEIAAAAASPTVVRQVRTLVADSERKQENELALRIATLYRDVQTERAADMGKVERKLDTLSNVTGLAVGSVRRQNEYITSQVRLLQKQ